MEFSSRQFGDVVLATPVGRIDHAAAPALEAKLLPLVDREGGPRLSVVLDFGGVDYISSVGLRVLMVAARHARARAMRIGVSALQPIVSEIFAISRFDAVLDIYPTVRAALASVSQTALVEFDQAQAPPPA